MTAGGPPGQTRIGNLGPLTRFTHRIKTHGLGWVHHQPSPGVYLWRTPHGYWYRVDQHGTRRLSQDPAHGPPADQAVSTTSQLEDAFARLMAA